MFNQFSVIIFFRILLISLTGLGLTWSIYQTNMPVTTFMLIFFWLIQILFLLRSILKHNHDLNRFIDALKFQDVSISFNQKNKNSFYKELYSKFDEILKEFKLIRKEKEIEHHFFQTTIQHLTTGLIAFDDVGKVEFCNTAFNNLFNIHKFKHLNEISTKHAEIFHLLKSATPSNSGISKLTLNSQNYTLFIKAGEIKISNRLIKVISISDAKPEIEQNEMEAWQKLIRILAHEITNSVSPIALLSKSLILQIQKNESKQFSDSETDEILLALEAIQVRSNGLLHFVDDYRKLTRIPSPVCKNFKIQNLFQRIEILFKDEFIQKQIGFVTQIFPDSLELFADERLIEQVIINLVKNSIEAINSKNHAFITLSAEIKNNHTEIAVTDSGKGISSEEIDKIFIPFFTTKENGSGIGLSLSRQIMRMHHGTISIQSIQNQKTTTTLVF